MNTIARQSDAHALRLFSPSPSVDVGKDPFFVRMPRGLGMALLNQQEEIVSSLRKASTPATNNTVTVATPQVVTQVSNTKPSPVSYGSITGIVMAGTDELSSYKTYVLNELLYAEQLYGSQAEYNAYAAQIAAATDQNSAWSIYISAPAYAREYGANVVSIAQRDQGKQVTGNPADLQFATINNPNAWATGRAQISDPYQAVFTPNMPPTGPGQTAMEKPANTGLLVPTISTPATDPLANLQIPTGNTGNTVSTPTDSSASGDTSTPAPATGDVTTPATGESNWFSEDALGFGFSNLAYLAGGFVLYLVLKGK